MIHTLTNETRKMLIIIWSYRVNVVMWTVFNVAMFSGIALLFGATEGVDRLQDRPAVLLGFLLTGFANSAISTMAWGLREEAQTGTLEQMTMSPHPVAWLVLGRLVAEVIVIMIQTSLLAIVVGLLLNFSLPLRIEGLPVLAITIAGLMGFGFIVGGLTLIYKRMDALANLLTNLLMWVNGTFVAITYFPDWLEAFVRLLPSTQGIIVLRRVMLDGESLATAWNSGSLGWLMLHSAVALAVGVAVFFWCERVARQRGTIGQY